MTSHPFFCRWKRTLVRSPAKRRDQDESVTNTRTHPLCPLQGESLSFDTESQDEVQGEPLSNIERGIRG
jgi:hypothetical protein